MIIPILCVNYEGSKKTFCIDTKLNRLLLSVFDAERDLNVEELKALKQVNVRVADLVYNQRNMSFDAELEFEADTFEVDCHHCYSMKKSICSLKYPVVSEEDTFKVVESIMYVLGNKSKLHFIYHIFNDLVFSDSVTSNIRAKNRAAFKNNVTTPEIDSKLSELADIVYTIFADESYLIGVDLTKTLKTKGLTNKNRKVIDLSFFDKLTPSAVFDILDYVKREYYTDRNDKICMKREKMKGLTFQVSEEQFKLLKPLKLYDFAMYSEIAKSWDDYINEGSIVIKKELI